MAKFTADIPLHMEYQGHEIEGATGATYRIPDSLKPAFHAAYNRMIPGLTWLVPDEIGNGGGEHPDLTAHDALGLATDTELGAVITDLGSLDVDFANHEGDSTAVHGIADTANLSLVGHTHQAFPVGSLFLATVSTNPATLLGYGTWSAFGAGRLLVGFDSGQTEFDTVEETGGAKTHTHAAHSDHAALVHAGAAVAAHSVTQPANHSVTQPSAHSDHAALGTHAHELPFQKLAGGTGVLRMIAASVFGTGTSRAAESAISAPTATTTSAAVELSQAVSAGTPSAHSAHTGTAVDAHSGVAVSAHSVTQPDNHAAQSHSAHDSPSSLPPYIVAYFWKRTA